MPDSCENPTCASWLTTPMPALPCHLAPMTAYPLRPLWHCGTPPSPGWAVHGAPSRSANRPAFPTPLLNTPHPLASHAHNAVWMSLKNPLISDSSIHDLCLLPPYTHKIIILHLRVPIAFISALSSTSPLCLSALSRDFLPFTQFDATPLTITVTKT